MKRAVVIAQSHSHDGQKDLKQAGDELRKRGVAVDASHLETGHKAIRKRLRQYVKSKAELIVLVGGDGTQTIAADALSHSESVLGIVPAGTGNSFAMSVGIDSLEAAFDAIAYGRVERIDVGVVNGTRFANFATIGLAAVVSDRTPRWLKHLTGPLAYGLSAVGPLLNHRAFDARVRWKKNRLRIETQQILVVNGRMYGHTPITPESTPNDGMLTFFATTRTSPIDVARTYLSFLNNTQTAIPEAHYFRSKKLTVKTSRKALVSIDGSALCKTPATFSVDRAALAVCVPNAHRFD
ncbi:MAG TPA: YegS/Rv2252/BmrU family lipid kinase [Candidatus Aquilonibacter sp.]|nr:YegS/Rv2252/BmrU family lipid kinase [Candidatus Aquilonibacter sp.]